MENMESWFNSVAAFHTQSFKNLQKFISSERSSGKSILPAENDVLNALKYTKLEEVKVVILGQDPYPNKRHAHGLAFSIPKSTKDIPKSLNNILKELESDLGIVSKSGNLVKWAKNGVILLNTILTVEEGISNAHKNMGWEEFTLDIIKTINKLLKNIVFILWGKQAQRFKKYLSLEKHLILEAPHPSPLSAYRGFFGSKPFSQTNSYLQKMGKSPIDWTL